MVCKQKVRYTENEKNCIEASILREAKKKPMVWSRFEVDLTNPLRSPKKPWKRLRYEVIWMMGRSFQKDPHGPWCRGTMGAIRDLDVHCSWAPQAFCICCSDVQCVHSFSSTWWIIGNLRQFDSDSWIITCVLRSDGLVWGYKISLPMVHNVGSSHKDMQWKRYLIL